MSSETPYDKILQKLITLAYNGPQGRRAAIDDSLHELLSGRIDVNEFGQALSNWAYGDTKIELKIYLRENLQEMRQLYEEGKLVIPKPAPPVEWVYKVQLDSNNNSDETQQPKPIKQTWEELLLANLAKAKANFPKVERPPAEECEPLVIGPYSERTIFETDLYKQKYQWQHLQRMEDMEKKRAMAQKARAAAMMPEPMSGTKDFDLRKGQFELADGKCVYKRNENAEKNRDVLAPITSGLQVSKKRTDFGVEIKVVGSKDNVCNVLEQLVPEKVAEEATNKENIAEYTASILQKINELQSATDALEQLRLGSAAPKNNPLIAEESVVENVKNMKDKSVPAEKPNRKSTLGKQKANKKRQK